MIPIIGAKLEKFPLQGLHIVADLVYYDGPLLTLLEDDSKEIYYLYYWCSVDDDCNRWLIFQVTERQIKNYLAGRVSLREVILNPVDRYYFLGDMDDNSEWQQVYLVMPDHLPKSYLPRMETPFDRELDGINEEDWQILEQRFLTASSYHGEISRLIGEISRETLEQLLKKQVEQLFKIEKIEKSAAVAMDKFASQSLVGNSPPFH